MFEGRRRTRLAPVRSSVVAGSGPGDASRERVGGDRPRPGPVTSPARPSTTSAWRQRREHLLARHHRRIGQLLPVLGPLEVVLLAELEASASSTHGRRYRRRLRRRSRSRHRGRLRRRRRRRRRRPGPRRTLGRRGPTSGRRSGPARPSHPRSRGHHRSSQGARPTIDRRRPASWPSGRGRRGTSSG